MFAIVKIAGQQFRVQEGQHIYVPHLSYKNGQKIEFTNNDILCVEKDGSFSLSSPASVKAEVVNSLIQGDKVIAFKMKRRKGFRKKHGHRTQYTELKIESIA
jgi:large subunit ribosomal protein L21